MCVCVWGGSSMTQHWAQCQDGSEKGGDQAWAGETSQRGDKQADILRTPHPPRGPQREHPAFHWAQPPLELRAPRLGGHPGTSACPAPALHTC